MAGKKRLDKILVERGIADTREKARGLILSGAISVNDRIADKAGFFVEPNCKIGVKKKESDYVSRGGVKLEGALNSFDIDVTDKTCLDVGASTGGFTDCLLKHGAKKIYAVDVGYGQLDWRLRTDPRVVVIERKNIRFIKPGDIPEKIDLSVIDVSFISLRLVFPSILPFIDKEGGHILALIKPQFEVGKGEVGKNGIVKSESKRQEVVSGILQFTESLNLKNIGTAQSKLPGAKGNIEIFVYCRNR